MSTPPISLARGTQLFPTDPPARIIAGTPGANFLFGGRVRWVLDVDGPPDGLLLLTRMRDGSAGRVPVSAIGAAQLTPAQWAEAFEQTTPAARPSMDVMIATQLRLENQRTSATWTNASFVWRRLRAPPSLYEFYLQHRAPSTWNAAGGSNELGFVGGGRDARDATPFDTARREMEEEMYGAKGSVDEAALKRQIIFTIKQDGSVVFVLQGAPSHEAVRGASKEVEYSTYPRGHMWWAPGDPTHGIGVWRLTGSLLAGLTPCALPLRRKVTLYHGTPSRDVFERILAEGLRVSIRGPGHPAACSSCRGGRGYFGSPACTCLMLGGPAIYLSPDPQKCAKYAGKDGVVVVVEVELGWCKEIDGTRDAVDHAGTWITQGYNAIHMTSGRHGAEEFAVADPRRVVVTGEMGPSGGLIPVTRPHWRE